MGYLAESMGQNGLGNEELSGVSAKDTLHTYTNSDSEYQFWKKIFDHVYNTLHHSSCWDYQWLFSIWNNNGFGIAPNINLVQNIAHGLEDLYVEPEAAPKKTRGKKNKGSEE